MRFSFPSYAEIGPRRMLLRGFELNARPGSILRFDGIGPWTIHPVSVSYQLIIRYSLTTLSEVLRTVNCVEMRWVSRSRTTVNSSIRSGLSGWAMIAGITSVEGTTSNCCDHDEVTKSRTTPIP